MALRTVRGGKMRTRREALDEMAAALQFPWYFGENWDALDECMQDLEWLGAKHVVIAVGDASELLADAPERDRETFAGVMKRAARERNGGAVLSLHAVLQVQTKPHSEKLAGWLGPLAPLGGA
ncbi:MAG: barstar family protein [Terriglobales bacterium]